MGQTEAAENAYAQALAEANRILAKRPTALKRLTRAKVYHAMGQLDAAKQDLRLVIQAAPNLTEAETLLKKLEAQ
jgi:tetratricopeptide (TPR) repeat protein